MCVSWVVRFWLVTVCWMRACAIVEGDAVGVLRVTAVDARVSRAWEPSGVRLAFSWERR
jgi:hypothetical protein